MLSISLSLSAGPGSDTTGSDLTCCRTRLLNTPAGTHLERDPGTAVQQRPDTIPEPDRLAQLPGPVFWIDGLLRAYPGAGDVRHEWDLRRVQPDLPHPLAEGFDDRVHSGGVERTINGQDMSLNVPRSQPLSQLVHGRDIARDHALGRSVDRRQGQPGTQFPNENALRQ